MATLWRRKAQALPASQAPSPTPGRPASSGGRSLPRCTPMSSTTRAARSRWESSMPKRSPGSSWKPRSAMSLSAYSAQPSPCPLTQQARRRQELSSSRSQVCMPTCRWWPGTPSWKTVVRSCQVAKSSVPAGTDHHMRPGREKSSLGPV